MFRYGNKPSIALLQTNRTKKIRKHQILGANYELIEELMFADGLPYELN